MKTRILILALTLGISPHLFAVGGGVDGNGSAGYCDEKECKTLAESGLKLERPDPSKGEVLPGELVKEVKRIISDLPIAESVKTKMLSQSLGDHQTFIRVDARNRDLAEAAKKNYRALLSSFIPDSQLSELKIFQVSPIGQNFSYIFPEFYGSVSTNTPGLSLQGQALSIIHEGNVRGRGPDYLATALELDSLIYRWINRSKTNPPKPGEFLGFIPTTMELYFIEPYEKSYLKIGRLDETLFYKSTLSPRWKDWNSLRESVLNKDIISFFMILHEVSPELKLSDICRQIYDNNNGNYVHSCLKRDQVLEQIGDSGKIGPNPILNSTLGFRIRIQDVTNSDPYFYKRKNNNLDLKLNELCSSENKEKYDDTFYIPKAKAKWIQEEDFVYLLKCEKNLEGDNFKLLSIKSF